MRVADDEREQVVAALRKQFAEGGLSLEEFGDRVEAAYAAVTADELPTTTARPEAVAMPVAVAPPSATWQAEPADVMMIYCTACGRRMSVAAHACPACGHPNRGVAQRPTRNRVVGIVLALLLGGLGVHKFYTAKVGLGVVYLVFAWTLIPALIATIEGIVWAFQSDETWADRQGLAL
jgi:TM2 domain-containing membrane protein YozV